MKTTLERKYDIRNAVIRGALAALAILLEVVWLIIAVGKLSESYAWISIVINVLAVLLVLGIVGERNSPSLKIPWIILIIALPLIGVLLYIAIGRNFGIRFMRKRYEKLDRELLPLLPENTLVQEAVERRDPQVASQTKYIHTQSGYPVYRNTEVIFYPDAAEGMAAQLKALKKAERFIFMEYHAIEASPSFGKLHDILKERAAAGVEVRIFYDYVGSMGFINNKFVELMEADGIRCRVFNPVMPFLNLFMNNRDHRKITVIDGKVGFTGGYNLADEYFHITEPYGYWLDTGVRLEGEAVRSLTIAFLENWNAIRNDDVDDVDYSPYLPKYSYVTPNAEFVQPFADQPLDDELVGENVYMNILRGASKYAYFTTPYLIITDEMTRAFSLAAKSGVDVRIITPGIPDKKLIYAVTRSYYAQLVQSGVRIYEFTPGFCHAKQCVSDDKVAFCGTINLDYRSLYHHFENGVLLYNCASIKDMKKQFDELFPQCREVTEQYKTGRSAALRLWQLVLRLFAPLM